MSSVTKLIIAISSAMLIRSLVSLHLYSGQDAAPMYGDFEAQRHWQEITINIPTTDWYRNTTANDLMYWGLDYPPLTAYHSYLMGKMANYLNSSYIDLYKSRGITTEQHKTFMRSTVLFADFFIYIPALIICCHAIYHNIWKSTKTDEGFIYLHVFIALIYPGQILIDNGHFQYNNISLGLATLAITSILWNKFYLGATFFVLALNYKQMELYHALPIFFYLLVNCFTNNKNSTIVLKNLKKFTTLSIIVLVTFGFIWLPWLRSFDDMFQVVHRIFPLARGVFEDKVSNFWCVSNVLLPIKEYFRNDKMVIICLTCTIGSILPSCIHLFTRPTKKNFLLSLIISSLGFFLFSYQVHEKSILLVTLPVILYFPLDPLACLWFLQIGTFSMVPLLFRDGLLIAFIACNFLYLLLTKVLADVLLKKHKENPESTFDSLKLICLFVFSDKNKKLTSAKSDSVAVAVNTFNQNVCIYLFYVSLALRILLLTASVSLEPPKNLPHLFPLLISIFSCGHFLTFFLYFNFKQLIA